MSSTNTTGISLVRGAVFIVPAVLVITLIIVGNFLVVVAVVREPKLRKQIQNWFIVSLAMADFLVGLLIMPISLIFEVLDRWILGQTMCELWLALDVLFVTASILNLCLISLDRYWSIVYTLEYLNKRTPARVFGMITIVWGMALSISFPPLVGWKAELAPGECGLSTDPGYVCYSALGSFFLPVIVLIFVYGRIFMISRKRNRARRAAAKKSCDAMLANRITECNSPVSYCAEGKSSSMSYTRKAVIPTATNTDSSEKVKGDQTDSEFMALSQETSLVYIQAKPGMSEDQIVFLKRQKKLRRQDLRATLILGIVLFSFILCWLPFFTLYILGPTGIKVPEKAFDVIFWLGYCNSAFNPIIYTFMNKDFRKAFKRILACRIC